MPPAEDLPNVRRLNRALAAAWRSGALPPPKLDADSLEASALRDRSPEVFGRHVAWRDPLRILTEALRDEADLNPLGKAMAHGQIVMALRARITAAALWRQRPDILQRPLPPPIIILGQMRSGTTRLQRLLACDERFAHTRFFESVMPVPRPGRSIRAGAILAFLRRLNPAVARIHPTAVSAPEEEFGLFSFSFGSAQFEAQWRVPGFSRWWEEAPKDDLYREFSALLRTIAWSRGESEARRWVIKAPQFLQDLPAVMDAFPEASLLAIERDPAQVVASSASLVWNQMRIQSDNVDRNWVGEEWLRKTRLRQDVAERALSSGSLPRLRIGYEAMNADWQGQMQRVYDHLGVELTPEVLRRMAHYLTNARDHRGHSYSLAEFGLSEAQIRSAFEDCSQVTEMRPVIPPAA